MFSLSQTTQHSKFIRRYELDNFLNEYKGQRGILAIDKYFYEAETWIIVNAFQNIIRVFKKNKKLSANSKTYYDYHAASGTADTTVQEP